MTATLESAGKPRKRHRRVRGPTPFVAGYRPSTPVTQPGRAHPLIKRLFKIMDEHQIGYQAMAERTGISHGGLCYWRRHSSPRLPSFIAALNVLGYDLRIVKRGDVSDEVPDEEP